MNDRKVELSLSYFKLSSNTCVSAILNKFLKRKLIIDQTLQGANRNRVATSEGVRSLCRMDMNLVARSQRGRLSRFCFHLLFWQYYKSSFCARLYDIHVVLLESIYRHRWGLKEGNCGRKRVHFSFLHSYFHTPWNWTVLSLPNFESLSTKTGGFNESAIQALQIGLKYESKTMTTKYEINSKSFAFLYALCSSCHRNRNVR